MWNIISTILAFCKQNCVVIGERGCDECNVGYVDKPECCDCDTTGNATHAFYRTTTGECKRKFWVISLQQCKIVNTDYQMR